MNSLLSYINETKYVKDLTRSDFETIASLTTPPKKIGPYIKTLTSNHKEFTNKYFIKGIKNNEHTATIIKAMEGVGSKVKITTFGMHIKGAPVYPGTPTGDDGKHVGDIHAFISNGLIVIHLYFDRAESFSHVYNVCATPYRISDGGVKNISKIGNQYSTIFIKWSPNGVNNNRYGHFDYKPLQELVSIISNETPILKTKKSVSEKITGLPDISGINLMSDDIRKWWETGNNHHVYGLTIFKHFAKAAIDKGFTFSLLPEPQISAWSHGLYQVIFAFDKDGEELAKLSIRIDEHSKNLDVKVQVLHPDVKSRGFDERDINGTKQVKKVVNAIYNLFDLINGQEK